MADEERGYAARAPHRERFRVASLEDIVVRQSGTDHFTVEGGGQAEPTTRATLAAARAEAYELARAGLRRLLELRRQQAQDAAAAVADLGAGDSFRLGMYRVANEEENGGPPRGPDSPGGAR